MAAPLAAVRAPMVSSTWLKVSLRPPAGSAMFSLESYATASEPSVWKSAQGNHWLPAEVSSAMRGFHVAPPFQLSAM